MNERRYRFLYQENNGQRLDKYLADCLPDISRSRIQRLIKGGFVEVNGETVTKTGMKLESQMVVKIVIPPPKQVNITPEKIPLDIIYENEDLMVVNKPAGMVVHPSAGHEKHTLVHAALAHAPRMSGVGGIMRPGIVHRLDKNTSGVIVLAKNDTAHQWLQRQFKEREVEKWYIALVDGHPATPTGRIDAPIGRDRSHRQRMSVVPLRHGRQAITEYYTKERFKRHTLLDVRIFTGRTHQIRVHLAFVGCPVVGDTVYGRNKPTIEIQRAFLHAARMKILLPGEKTPREFEAPLPDALEKVLRALRREEI